MTKNALVLGAGRVGAVLAADLARDPELAVTVADVSPAALEAARARGVRATLVADLSRPEVVRDLARGRDLVVGALPSRFGFGALRAVLEAGAPLVDISFMPEDARALDALARERGVTAVVDFGVAPGMSHLLAAWGVARLGGAERVRIYVGGVPRHPRPPLSFKAAFAPSDVVEEYTRPARVVEGGRIVTKPALVDLETLEFEGLGALEGALTDGLRSLVHTLDVPDMAEKTLRWPGHYAHMLAFREAGLFASEPIDVGGVRVRPLDVTTALLVRAWTYAQGEEDLTAMRVEVRGARADLTWDVVDRYDVATGTSSMARTTAFPCAIVARLVLAGRFQRPGIHPPEALAADDALVRHILREHAARGIEYRERAEPRR